jgi:hypothetical protein
MTKGKKMTKRELIGCIAGIIGIISICFAVYFWFENRYAHAGDMVKAMEVIQKMGTHLDLHIMEGELRATQQKIWAIEDRYCKDTTKPCDESKMPELVKKQYRELKVQREELQKELDNLKKAKK